MEILSYLGSVGVAIVQATVGVVTNIGNVLTALLGG